ncbi:DUF1758 domain-containing protein [Trichonephila clavipes]|nr:DUF1758 domain-containing protein [Trichonephila clavipes]
MTFLRLEVQGEEVVQLTKSGFGTPIRKKDSPTERVMPTELMTASALASSEKSSDQERKVRVLIDTACENSYISESVTSILKATPLREETIILSHSLFGGNETKPKHHSVYSIEDYKSVFRQWEDLNIIERVPEEELNNECHYLPHRPVIKLDSATTKIRPVFDASAREKGKPSLNDCLYKGVNLIELIPGILDRFRIYPVGIVADIKKVFLMLSVAPKDREYLSDFFSNAMKNN